MSCLGNNTVVYTQNSRNLQKNLLKLKSEFSNIPGYKVNIQKLILSLHTSNKQVENTILKIYNVVFKF